jgi:hypothetical protein
LFLLFISYCEAIGIAKRGDAKEASFVRSGGRGGVVALVVFASRIARRGLV